MKKQLWHAVIKVFPAIQKMHQKNTSIQNTSTLLCENDFETVLVNFCCYEYIIVPDASEA